MALVDKKLSGLALRSLKRTRDVFLGGSSLSVEGGLAAESTTMTTPSGGDDDVEAPRRARLAAKLGEYAHVMHMPTTAPSAGEGGPPAKRARTGTGASPSPSPLAAVPGQVVLEEDGDDQEDAVARSLAAVAAKREAPAGKTSGQANQLVLFEESNKKKPSLDLTVYQRYAKPTWHAPWRLRTVLSSHTGQVRCVSVEPGNEWFATGSADRTIKLFDLASQTLKITLTGHIATVRGVVVSARHPYLFSVGEDRQVKCWDLESNKIIRHYYGHLNGIYCVALHPKLDLLVTGGRDSTARVWDIRTKAEVHVLGGHSGLVASLLTQAADPQITTGSSDTTLRTWDIRTGKTLSVLTNHKKSIRAMVGHPSEFTFASAAADNIKKWRYPKGEFMQNITGHNAIINTLAVNDDSVMFSGGDNGSLRFFDWNTGYCFQEAQTQIQPGSLESEAGIFASTFDQSGSRLITCEADKSIKIWAEDDEASPESHPVDPTWRPSRDLNRF